MQWAERLIERTSARLADELIGFPDTLMQRWYLAKSRWLNVYLHNWLRSDRDRAHHDHPWPSLTIVLRGQLVEHTIDAGGIHRRRLLKAGQWRLRPSGAAAHRIEVVDGPTAWTLFITGPKYREWGFHCTNGWVHWREFHRNAQRQGNDDAGCAG